MLPSVSVVSHRPEVREALAALLEDCARCRRRELAWRPQTLSSPSLPTTTIIDVLCLFTRKAKAGVPVPRIETARVMVVGLRRDSDAMIAAFSEGIPVHVLEDLTAESLARITGASRGPRSIYFRFARLCAQRVKRLLVERWEREALSRREVQVLSLLGKGHTNAEIAAALSIEVQTVKNHLNHIYRKLGVSGRYEAITRNGRAEGEPPRFSRTMSSG